MKLCVSILISHDVNLGVVCAFQFIVFEFLNISYYARF
jgi:hypothetical protein